MAEYPHGFEHGLIIHHHLPPRIATPAPLNPDHHYNSYPGRIIKRPKKPAPVYFGTTKPPKQQNEYYRPVSPDITPVKPHSLPPLLAPPPNGHFQAENFHYQFNHVQHPPPRLTENLGYQIHHEAELSPNPFTLTHPAYNPTATPSFHFDRHHSSHFHHLLSLHRYPPLPI